MGRPDKQVTETWKHLTLVIPLLTASAKRCCGVNKNLTGRWRVKRIPDIKSNPLLLIYPSADGRLCLRVNRDTLLIDSGVATTMNYSVSSVHTLAQMGHQAEYGL